MKWIDTLIIGGGQAGLAMSHSLSELGIDHLILERGRVAERWRSERWDSLRLLSPNWQLSLPGFHYDGDDPDGFLSMPEVIEYFERYARSFSAPVQDETRVRSIRPDGCAYRVATDRGTFRAGNVVLATGYCDIPHVPAVARGLGNAITQTVPTRYKNPDSLPDGGVLVVGASASGAQLAEEIHRSGRPVTLAVGDHIRLPRNYRGRDILWWLDAMGTFDETTEQLADDPEAMRAPSLQLVGRPDHSDLDLDVLQRLGVRLVGRVIDTNGTQVRLADDLEQTTRQADGRMGAMLTHVDRFIERAGLTRDVAGKPALRHVLPNPAPVQLDLAAEGIETVLWATGFKRDYSWLEVPILDSHGEIRHQGGVTAAPGLYAMGLKFQRRRRSSFINGVGQDAEELAAHIDTRMAGWHSSAA